MKKRFPILRSAYVFITLIVLTFAFGMSTQEAESSAAINHQVQQPNIPEIANAEALMGAPLSSNQMNSVISDPVVEGTTPTAKEMLVDMKALRKELPLRGRIALKILERKIEKQMKKDGTEKAHAGKSQLVALLLCLFLGYLGIHRFYLGYTGAGIIQLLTGGGCGIWAFIDLIRIITGDLKPKNGEYETTF
jgi:TM2 domain-containing membrane protein YozV